MARSWTVLTLIAIMLPATSGFAARYYVDLNASGGETGLSWPNAFRTIQPAANAASSGDEIWVAQGVYNETRTDPSGALVLKAGVTLYGGFRGNENNLSQRNWQTRITTIDGSVARSGAAAYHTAIGASGTVLDGFTVTGGNANGGTTRDRTGGGLLHETTGTTMTIRNCRFTSNTSLVSGGAIGGINASTISVDNCTFTGNSSASGGAAGSTQTALTFVSCTFESNTATSGGAVEITGTAALQFSLCILKGNQAANNGGAIRSASPVTATNCLFQSNTATASNGGAIAMPSSTATIVNCNFYGNSAGGLGGAINDASGGMTLKNCILWSNGAIPIGGTPASLTYSCIEGGYGIPAYQNTALNPMFANAAVDDFRLKFGSPCINTGSPTGAPAVDIRGVARPQSGAYDMGIYEMQAGEFPVVNFYAIPESGSAPLVVQFTDLSSAGTDPLLTWYWDFGDQHYSSQQHPVHLYSVEGVYSITLTASSILGSVTMTRTNYITVGPGTGQLLADFTATPTRAGVPFVVQFTDLSSAGTATILDWYWDFGDGQNSPAQNPSHQYDTPGRYTVSLTIMTTQGNVSATKTEYIEAVGALPAAGNTGMVTLALLVLLTGIGVLYWKRQHRTSH